MDRAIVHDPEDATSVVVGRSCHHLLDQPVERCDAILRLTAAEDSGVVYVQRGEVGPGTAAEVLMLDAHGSAGPASLRCMLTATGLNAGFFVGGDHEFVILQCIALPLAGIQVEHATCFGGEVRITWKNPTAVIPRPNGVVVQPAP